MPYFIIKELFMQLPSPYSEDLFAKPVDPFLGVQPRGARLALEPRALLLGETQRFAVDPFHGFGLVQGGGNLVAVGLGAVASPAISSNLAASSRKPAANMRCVRLATRSASQGREPANATTVILSAASGWFPDL